MKDKRPQIYSAASWKCRGMLKSEMSRPKYWRPTHHRGKGLGFKGFPTESISYWQGRQLLVRVSFLTDLSFRTGLCTISPFGLLRSHRTTTYYPSKPQSKDGDYCTSQISDVFGFLLHHRLSLSFESPLSLFPHTQGSDWRENHVSQIHIRINTLARRGIYRHFPWILAINSKIRILKNPSS